MKSINKLVIVYVLLLSITAVVLTVNFTPKNKTEPNISATSTSLASTSPIQPATADIHNVKFDK